MANGIVGQIHVNDNDYLIGSTLYGECTDASNEPIKKVVLKNNALYTDTEGLTIHVKFTHGNTVNNNLQLQIRNGGTSGNYSYSTAHPIANPMIWQDNCIISFTYDGTNWVINSAASASGVTSITPGNGLINSTNGSNQNDPITSTGTISIATGGVTNAMLQNDSITINNREIILGSNSVSLAELGITEVMHFKGTTTTAIGPTTTATITINGTSYTASAGDVLLYDGKEYVWTGTVWEELGDESSFAYRDQVVNINGGAAGDLLIWTSTNAIDHLHIPSPVSSNTFLTINNGLPSWSTIDKSTIDLGNVVNATQITSLGWDYSTKTITYQRGIYNSENNPLSNLLTFSAGDNISLSAASGTTTLTITAYNNAVAQTAATSNNEYPILLKNSYNNNNNASDETNGVHYVGGITINPSTGTITATNINASIDWNNINGISSTSLEYVGALSVVSSSSSQTNNATQLGEVQNGVLYINALSINTTTTNVITVNNNNNTP